MVPCRVLVVDDSPTARAMLRQVLQSDPDITVVGEATTGAEGLEGVQRLHPSIVVMDINMPQMDGFEATKRIMIAHPTPIIIVTASDDPLEVEVSLKAVGAGALTAVPKPAGPGLPNHHAEVARFLNLVKALADVKVVRQRQRFAAPVEPPVPLEDEVDPRRGSVRIVGVAASTGGPQALFRFLQALPRDLDVPVLVVQHISKGFVDGLARWLSTASVLPVCVATANAPLRGGEVYLAPDDRHLIVRADRIALSNQDPVGGFRPSANVLFRSLAESHRSAAAAVVLTGMGEDGLDGAAQIGAAGGLVMAQDADSSAVFGMPRAVVTAGFAHAVGPVEDLACRIARLSLRKEHR